MEIIIPMFFLVCLTFVVGISLGAARMVLSAKGQADPRYFKLWAGFSPPDHVQKLERNFSNLFEVPVIFYLAGVIAMTINVQNAVIHCLAWAFVALRYVHSIIHITYNNPLHRMIVFLLSSLMALAMWGQLVAVVAKDF